MAILEISFFPKLPFFSFDARSSQNSHCLGRDSTKLTQLIKMKPKMFEKLRFRFWVNRRNNPPRPKVSAGVENFRRSTTRKLLKNVRGTKLRLMSLHHRGSIRISVLTYHQCPCITMGSNSHSRSLMVTHSHSWYKVTTNVHAPPRFDLGHSTKLPPMSMHPNGHSQSLTVTHGHSRPSTNHSWKKCF